MGEFAKDITNRTQLDRIMSEDGPTVMIDFWASWCGPCRTMAPHFEAVAEEYADKPIEYYKLDTEAHPQMASIFNIRSLPTVLIVSGGEVLDVLIGVQDARSLAKKSEWAMSKARGEGFFDRLLGRRNDA